MTRVQVIASSAGSDQQHPHGNQPALEGIQHEPEALEGRGAQERLVPLLAEDHGSRPALALVLESYFPAAAPRLLAERTLRPASARRPASTGTTGGDTAGTEGNCMTWIFP